MKTDGIDEAQFRGEVAARARAAAGEPHPACMTSQERAAARAFRAAAHPAYVTSQERAAARARAAAPAAAGFGV